MVHTSEVRLEGFSAEARELIDYATALAGRQVVVREVETTEGHLATVNIVAGVDEPHTIRYQRRQAEHRDHLVSHECSHLIRFYRADLEDQLVPMSAHSHFRRSVQELEDDAVRLHGIGVPEHAIGELFTMYHQGLIFQVVNFPADMRIERWLRENYPGLGEPQEHSIRQQLIENEQPLRRQVKELTPTKVYKASATMNTAYARFMELMYEDDSMAVPYRRTPYWQQGIELSQEIWLTPDAGYRGDVQSAKEWARLFGVEDWFEWKSATALRDGDG